MGRGRANGSGFEDGRTWSYNDLAHKAPFLACTVCLTVCKAECRLGQEEASARAATASVTFCRRLNRHSKLGKQGLKTSPFAPSPPSPAPEPLSITLEMPPSQSHHPLSQSQRKRRHWFVLWLTFMGEKRERKRGRGKEINPKERGRREQMATPYIPHQQPFFRKPGNPEGEWKTRKKAMNRIRSKKINLPLWNTFPYRSFPMPSCSKTLVVIPPPGRGNGKHPRNSPA